MKVEAQLNNQPTIRNIAKLLMNSMYGRFGMHVDLTKTAFIHPKKVEEFTENYKILSFKTIGEVLLAVYTLDQTKFVGGLNQLKIWKSYYENIPGKTNVAIASAVTAYSRMIINEFKLLALKNGLELFYSDTDSLVLNGPLPEIYLDSATLGKLKLEYKIKEGIFVMPKVYYLETSEGKIVTKCKGYSGLLTREDYINLLNGKSLHLSMTKWFRSLVGSTVEIRRNQTYDLRFLFNKRNQVFEHNKWVNTTPLILSYNG